MTAQTREAWVDWLRNYGCADGEITEYLEELQ